MPRIPRIPRIAVRLLLFNVLLVFLPLAGVVSLRTLERQLLDVQERSMVQQGRLVAAALSSGTLDAASARALIERLGGHSESRIRVVDLREKVLADSAAIPVRSAPPEPDEYASGRSSSSSRRSLLYRFGAAVWRWLEPLRRDPPSSRGGSDVTPHTVVKRALEGRYAATLQESAGQRSLTLYSVLPIRAAGNGPVTGAVIVSQSTSRILAALWRVRLNIFKVFVYSVLAAAILSLIFATTIARPLVRLRDEADDLLDHRGRLKRPFRGSHRNDEIGDLTRALEKLTARLERHLALVESLPADVSHEFKNPLASIRSAAELLARSDEEEEKQQLGATIEKEVARLSRLLNGVREVSKIDAALDTEAARPVDVREVVSEVATGRVAVDLPPHPVIVSASEERLAQAVRNIVDNAVSFSPRVTVAVREQNGHALIRVDDDGPGIPPEHLERVFDRFFSFREAHRADHDGLGLAIAKAVVDGYGGRITASNREEGGSRFEVRLPLAG
ncbi:MAG TPA: ATP-binding protein [Thermoanaerobaculia bacterium]|nr:ATP-binding protein [Thermoanaerobaculia bacterium]